MHLKSQPFLFLLNINIKKKQLISSLKLIDKRIVVVDDSIMRGTTMRKIIKMFRAAGAREVHVRISAPPTKFPCFYGIDIPTHSELIAATHTIEEIKKYLRVDSIEYMTVKTLLDAVDRPGKKFCTACFDGNYPCSFENSTECEESQKYLFEEGNGEYY